MIYDGFVCATDVPMTGWCAPNAIAVLGTYGFVCITDVPIMGTSVGRIGD